MKTRSPEQSIVGLETQWTQTWSRVRSQADVIHLVRSTSAIVSNPHLHSVKSYPLKSRPIKYGGQMHSVMIAIEYSYKLDRKNYFNLWCELGRLLLRQSHMTMQKDIRSSLDRVKTHSVACFLIASSSSSTSCSGSKISSL